MSSPLAISWTLSTVSGYGIYGLQILLQFLRRGGASEDFILTQAPSATVVTDLTLAKIKPIFDLASRLHEHLKSKPHEQLHFKHAVLHGLSADFRGFDGQDRVWGSPNIGCAAIEELVTTAHGRDVAKHYDYFIAISRWNRDYLESLNLGPVHLHHQGVDRSLFRPGPDSGLYRDRFVIFSGGKFEFRKGQDIVVAAFKKFRVQRPDALLVTAWQNFLTPDLEPFMRAGHVQDVPARADTYGLKIGAWLRRQGLPPESFIDLPFISNMFMPTVLRDCALAVFPNRSEGGTNLVAMEALACGIPTYASYNTGQKDLVDLMGAKAFRIQKDVAATNEMRSVHDWGETEVDEVVAAMEHVYQNRERARQEAEATALAMAPWDWQVVNENLLQRVCEGKKTL